MSVQPRVSVVLANWNSARFLGEAIQSVGQQTFGNWELIIVDTGSDDGSREIIQRRAKTDGRIKAVFEPLRLTCPAAINLGLGMAQGDFIARIESDDLWRPDRLKRQLDFFEFSINKRVGVCGSDATLIDASGRVLGVKRFPRGHQDCLRTMWYRNPFCHSSVLMRRAVFENCGPYDEAFALVDDLELWFRVAVKWEFANLPESLVCYRVWRGSLTTRKLRELAWRSHKVRARAVSQFGYARPWLPRTYSIFTLFAALLPPLLVRRCFEFGVGFLGPSARSDERARQRSAKQAVDGPAHPMQYL